MAIDQQELARRLRKLRETCNMTQAAVAKHLGISRSAVTEIETGRRSVSGLELHRLAYLYARDLEELLTDEFVEREPITALFRRHRESTVDEATLEALRKCVVLGREVVNLEGLLGIRRESLGTPSYALPMPDTKWEAVRQGSRAAGDERRRLDLGVAALPDVAELLEDQGIVAAQEKLPDDVSGLTLIDPGNCILTAVNVDHHVLRRRFSLAHEYAHVLFDREGRGTISRSSERDNFEEVRANAFAASFLMPEEGIRSMIHGLAKGHSSRNRAEIFDEDTVLSVEGRPPPGSQQLQLYDVVRLAHRFRVSCAAMLYRLKGLRLINERRRAKLAEEDAAGRTKQFREILDLPEPPHAEARKQSRSRFLSLAIEAYRREEISTGKWRELVRLIDEESDPDAILEDAGLRELEPLPVMVGDHEPL
ncbi:helix-turn-helix domain-containing protein [Candidatus Palauibacter sp.]|uniref:helix-turn-helix domain-containing protein n=1 Tax=Candidatus Palauibacter sp. TaxID=3101350 RepID=UPI003B5CF8C1